ncbi:MULTISPECIES: hypothetical protein [Achromobacter]|uniref:hypothetical protein n=1 Tax=Achromobacter TaxID=222 RepID=UPI001419EF4B|nr:MULTISPECIES: hypothetical protein [Achromobacter]MBD9381048.1 hypothetical protein [Achromobacter sp. ACM02]MBD9419217.1 hypothetical protein [Achromobacter sp. ACM04]MBD9429608.1 hypothetical protein [Achromobacter sp. ACM03]
MFDDLAEDIHCDQAIHILSRNETVYFRRDPLIAGFGDVNIAADYSDGDRRGTEKNRRFGAVARGGKDEQECLPPIRGNQSDIDAGVVGISGESWHWRRRIRICMAPKKTIWQS